MAPSAFSHSPVRCEANDPPGPEPVRIPEGWYSPAFKTLTKGGESPGPRAWYGGGCVCALLSPNSGRSQTSDPCGKAINSPLKRSGIQPRIGGAPYV